VAHDPESIFSSLMNEVSASENSHIGRRH